MTCTTNDGQQIRFLKEEYACSTLNSPLEVQQGIKLRNLLNDIKHCLPIAVLIHPTYCGKSSDPPREGHKQPAVYQFILDDLAQLHSGAKALTSP